MLGTGDKRLICLVIFLFLSPLTSFCTNYYLSNSGSDLNDGLSPSTPWQTIDQLNAVVLQPGDSILFEAGGIYRGEIVVTESGSPGSPLYFGRYGAGENPVISGAESLNGWTIFSGTIYFTSWPGSDRQLFWEDERMTKARYPNSGFLFHDGAYGTSALLDSSLNEADNFWKGARVKIRTNNRQWESLSVDSSAADVVYFNSPPQNVLLPGYGYFFENQLALLDSAGEWFWDSATSTLFFQSPDGSDPSLKTVEVSSRDFGIAIKNSAQHILLHQLNFVKQLIAGISVTENSSFITISECSVIASAEIGINLQQCNRIVSEHCSVSDCGVTAAYLFQSNQVTVQENLFSRIGLEAGGGSTGELSGYGAIAIDCDSLVFSGNLVDRCGNGGLKADGTFLSIQKNSFADCFLTVNGNAVINCSGPAMADLHLADNFIFAQEGNVEATPGKEKNASGIFVSGECINGLIEHNSISKTSGPGLWLGPGSKFYTLRNNLVFGAAAAQLLMEEGNNPMITAQNSVTGNTFYALHETTVPVELTGHTLAFSPAALDSNYYFNPYGYHAVQQTGADSPAISLRYTLEQWQRETGNDENSNSTFFFRHRLEPLEITGGELIQNGHFTNNTDGWLSTVPENILVLLDNSTPLDFGCMKLVKPDAVPYAEGAAAGEEFEMSADKFYRLSFSTYSTRDWNVRMFLTSMDEAYSGITAKRYFPVSAQRKDYEAILQSPLGGDRNTLQVNITYLDSLVWVDNLSLQQVTALITEPEKLSRLFQNPTAEPLPLDLGDSIFYNLDQQVVSGNLLLEPYSSAVLIFDSSLITQIHAEPAVAVWNVFPNPVSAGAIVFLQLSAEEKMAGQVELIDLAGRKCFSARVSPSALTPVQLPEFLSAGLYFLRFGHLSAKLLVK